MMTDPAYPLRCEPYFRDYLWGGRNLQTRLGKALPDGGPWAESWELIDHPQHSSLITNGPLAGKTLGQAIVEKQHWLLGNRFDSLPLLLKYLDCQNVLSVQVHPDDAYARAMTPPDWGKTEAWYVIDRRPGSLLYAGLKPGVSRLDLARAIEAGTVDRCLHTIYPEPGDCLFIPAGTVHALGAGLLVAEIQQASNTTFRLFDWNRVGPDGRPRQLHIAESLSVSDYESGPRALQIPQATLQPGRQRLVTCDKFTLDRLSDVTTITLAGDDRFHFITAPNGGVIIEGDSFQEMLSLGQSLLLPAALGKCLAKLEPDSILLDMYIE